MLRRSKQLWDIPTPLVCDRPEALAREQRRLEQQLHDREQQSRYTKEAVRVAMANIENVSVNISGQELFDERV